MGARRSYAFHPDATQVNGREWTKFLIYWMKNPKQLEAMARLLLVSSAKDLSADTAAVLRKLRDFHQVLLLKKDDSMQRYQCTLKRLDKFGILDLSFALVGPQQKPLFFEQAKTRSLRCKWRESEKRVKLLRRCVTFHSTATQAECEAHKKTKQKLEETKATAYQHVEPCCQFGCSLGCARKCHLSAKLSQSKWIKTHGEIILRKINASRLVRKECICKLSTSDANKIMLCNSSNNI